MSSPFSLLACPGCGSRLSAEPPYQPSFDAEDFGILNCDCSSYPVVAGIPVIFRGGIPETTSSATRICKLIRNGNFGKALLDLVSPPARRSAGSAVERLAPRMIGRRLANRRVARRRREWCDRFLALAADFSSGSGVRLIRHYFQDRIAAASYFAYRAGQPKYLVTAALAALAPATATASLDIGCGAGHFTRLQSSKHGPGKAFGVDSDFFLLWVAKTRTSPDSVFVCCDVELGLPFQDDSFDFALLSNFFHFIFGKRYLLREIDRVSRSRSTAAITSLRHRAVAAPVPNVALSLAGYRVLAADCDRMHHILSESAILDTVLRHAPLQSSPSDEDLSREPLIDLLLTDQPVERMDLAFERQTPDRARYRANPLYVESPRTDGGLHWKLQWPGEQYLADNPEIESYLPEELELSTELLHALRSGLLPGELLALIKVGALVDLPECY